MSTILRRTWSVPLVAHLAETLALAATAALGAAMAAVALAAVVGVPVGDLLTTGPAGEVARGVAHLWTVPAHLARHALAPVTG